MIANAVELRVAARNLKIMEEAHLALRQELEIPNPELLAVTPPANERRIALLQQEIVQYLAEHPAEVSLILPPIEAMVAKPSAT